MIKLTWWIYWGLSTQYPTQTTTKTFSLAGVMVSSCKQSKRDTGSWSMRWIWHSSRSWKVSMRYWTIDAQSISLSWIRSSSATLTSLCLRAKTPHRALVQHQAARLSRSHSWIDSLKSTLRIWPQMTTAWFWIIKQAIFSIKTKLIACCKLLSA